MYNALMYYVIFCFTVTNDIYGVMKSVVISICHMEIEATVVQKERRVLNIT